MRQRPTGTTETPTQDDLKTESSNPADWLLLIGLPLTVALVIVGASLLAAKIYYKRRTFLRKYAKQNDQNEYEKQEPFSLDM